MLRKGILIFLLSIIGGCTHPIDIVGEGDIRSTSGDNDCLLEDLPCKAETIDEYEETYFPEPRSGYEFVGWDNCLVMQGDSCVFNISAEIVHDNWGKTMPTLVAKFAPLCLDAPASSFASIQTVIFNGKGCSGGGCHSGAQPHAGMNLSTGNAYANIVNVDAQTGGGLKRILPGDANNSYLYRKVSAKSNPGSFQISGSPMPLVGSALSDNQLKALGVWINAGAPQTGRATELREVEQLLGLCESSAPPVPPPGDTGGGGGGGGYSY